MIRDMIRAKVRAFLGINEVALTAEKAQSMSEFVLQALDKTDDRLDLLISRVDPLIEFPETWASKYYTVVFDNGMQGSIVPVHRDAEFGWQWDGIDGESGSVCYVAACGFEETPQAALKALLQAAEPRQPLKILG